MSQVPNAALQVTRVLSNNAVVAAGPDGQDVVALGRGLGHRHRPGATLDPERIEQVFVASGEATEDRLTQFLTDVPLVCVQAAAAAAQIASERLNIKVTQGLILPLADHLNFAVRRQREAMELQVPLRWEVRQLYPNELSAAKVALAKANQLLGVELHPDEAVSIALHFVNAQFATPGLNQAVQMTEKISQITDSVERSMEIELDPDSMSTARFITHLR